MFRAPKLSAFLAPCILLLAAVSSSQVRAKDIVDTAVEAGTFKTLAAALQAADLVDALKGDGPFTVFAPTDDAFAKLPEGTVETLLKPENKQALIGVLTFHVLSGQFPASDVTSLAGAETLNGQRVDFSVNDGAVSVEQADVVATDIVCTNGVIHVIDQVILPASDDIPTSAKNAGNFNTLLAAVQAAGLGEALSGTGPFTVFAPTDEAFAKLPEGTVESLLQPENLNKLAAILKYHVVPGRVYSPAAIAAGTASTLQGSPITISVDGEIARVNEAQLVATDIDASNGVIHVIDSVLLPPSGSQQAVLSPRTMIEMAINQGAPMYNAGDKSGCARIYMETANTLLSMDNHGMSSSATQTLVNALNSSAHMTSSDSKAWTMRRALDQVYHEVR